MFMVREYAACLLLAVVAAALFFAACGIFRALKAACRIGARRAHRLTRVRIREACVSTIRYLTALCFLIVLPSLARPQEAPSSQDWQGDGFTIRVSVDQVVLHATVRDRR